MAVARRHSIAVSSNPLCITFSYETALQVIDLGSPAGTVARISAIIIGRIRNSQMYMIQNGILEPRKMPYD
jgi:hypothetical protein